MAQTGDGGASEAAAQVSGGGTQLVVPNTAAVAAQVNGVGALSVVGDAAAAAATAAGQAALDAEAAPVAAPAAIDVAAAPVAPVAAGPLLANLPGALFVALGGLQTRYDVDAVLLGPLPRKNNISCEIHAWVDEDEDGP